MRELSALTIKLFFAPSLSEGLVFGEESNMEIENKHESFPRNL
jgi:hypothetical protein